MNTPNYFPALRTTRRPNELEMIMSEKGKQALDHIQGAVVRLQQIPKLVAPYTEKLEDEEKSKLKQTIFIGSQISNESMYEIYYNNNLLLCDPQMEKTYFTNTEMDDKFSRLSILPELSNYFSLTKQISIKHKSDNSSVNKRRKIMHDNLWFSF